MNIRGRLAAVFFAGTLAASSASSRACASTATGDVPGGAPTPGPAAVVESFPGTLPASFSGDLPCADCLGVRHIVELHADNVFVYRMTYLGRGEGGEGASFDDIGRWVLSPDGATLTLRGGREAPVLFAIKDARTLRKLDLEGRPIVSSLNYDLVRTANAPPLEPQLHLRGMYSYMADAGLFVECSTGWRVPVAMEADNVALERGYLAVRKEAGEPVLVNLEGRLAMRPGMEGAGLQRSLVPLRFVRAWPGRACESGGGDAGVTSLAGTGWRLVNASIGVPTPDDVSRIALRFVGERLSAASGCNSGTAGYTLAGGALVVQLFATTRKACLPPWDQWETAFFRFLASKPAVTREGENLILVSPGGTMRFRSMPVPSAAAVQKFIYVAAERKPCSGVAPMDCLQVRDKETDPWRLHYGEIIGFTHVPGIEYRLRILEDAVPNPPADGAATRWFLDVIVEQRVVKR